MTHDEAELSSGDRATAPHFHVRLQEPPLWVSPGSRRRALSPTETDQVSLRGIVDLVAVFRSARANDPRGRYERLAAGPTFRVRSSRAPRVENRHGGLPVSIVR
jgi:hypothetical protein